VDTREQEDFATAGSRGFPCRVLSGLLGREPLAAAVVILLLASCGCRRKPGRGSGAPDEAAAEASPVAAFLRGNGLDGRIVLVEFGTIGCERSGEGLEAMIAMHRRGTVPGLSFVRLEAASDGAAVEAYYAEKSPPFPVVRDPEAEIARALAATAFPSFALLDRFGRVRYRGKLPDSDDLLNWVEALKAENVDPGPGAALFGATKLDAPRLLAATRLPDLAGTVRPLAEYGGEAGLLVVFVDTNCPFAGSAIGDIPEVSATLAAHKVACILVNLGDPAETVEEIYRSRKVGADVVYDVGTSTQLTWNVRSVPTVVLIGTSSQMAYNGPAVWSDVAGAVTRMLSLPKGSITFGAEGTEYG
jgi:hypothetical protein